MVTGTWWRHVPHRGSPYYRPPDPADGRWNHGIVVEGWYFADSPEAVWAEWYRYLAKMNLRPDVLLPRDLWRWRINLADVADLRTAARLARVGLALPTPDTSWAPFQNVGGALFTEGWPALVAPSAARQGGRTLCVFRAADRVTGIRPIPPPRVHRHPPTPPTGMRT